MPFGRRLLEFFLPYRQRATAEYYDVDPTSGDAISALTSWDWADLNLIVFNNGAFWADWLTDWLFPIVSGTAQSVAAARGDIAALEVELSAAKGEILAAIAGGAPLDFGQVVDILTRMHLGLGTSIAEVTNQLFSMDTRFEAIAARTAAELNGGMRGAAAEIATPLRDVAATFLASLGPILEGVTKDFVGDREKVEEALRRVLAGQGGQWVQILSPIIGQLIAALYTAGSIYAASNLAEILEHYPRLREKIQTAASGIGQGMAAGIHALHVPMEAVMGGLSEIFLARLDIELLSMGEASESNVIPTAVKLLQKATGAGMAAHMISALTETVTPLKALGLGQVAAMLVDVAGFEGITRNSIGVLYETALREPARRRANRAHRPNLPDKATMEQLFLERRLAPEELADFYRTQGWPEHFIDRWIDTLPIEATPRDLALVFEDVEIDPLWAQDHLRQRGFTDDDAFRITEGLRTRAVKSQRGQAVGALVANYADGLLDQATLAATLRELRFTDEAVSLTLLSAEHKRLNGEAEKSRTILESAAAQGAISVEEVGASMAAYGYDERAQSQAVSRARLKLGVQLFRDEAGDLKAAVRRAQQDAITAAMEQFRRFQLDAGGLTGFLRQWGIKDEEVDALVALAVVRRQPVPRLPEVLTPEAQVQAALRVERDGILELTRKGLMGESAAVAALAALGLDPRLARAEAHLAAARRAPPLDVVKPPTLDEIQDARQRALADAAVARFRGGLLSSGGLRSALTSAGLAAPVAAAFTEREVARAEAARAQETLDLLERQLREERDAQEAAAVAAFRAGRIDAGGLLQNLVALGISRVTAQAIVDREMIVQGSRPAPAGF